MSVDPSLSGRAAGVPAARPDVGVALDDRYRLDGHLASGGTAEVYVARDLRLDRDVAVKVLKERATLNAAAERFEAEARTLARLSHPGIVTILDAGSHGTTPYIVCELVDGVTLAAARDDRSLEPARLGRILTEVAEALAYAHGVGIIHRDVKPANILLRPDHRAQLADFGIARLLDQTTTHTQTGQLVGSAAYLAPEQAQGHAATAATDVYALGLVMLELLTGRPQPTGTLIEILAARSTAPDVPHDLEPAWRDLIAAMVQQDPTRRPTAAEVAERAVRLPADPSGPAVDGSTTAVLPPPTDPDTTVALQAPSDRGSAWMTEAERRAEAAWQASAAASRRGWAHARRRTADTADWLGDALKPVLLVVAGLVAFIVILALASGGGPEDPAPAEQQPAQQGEPAPAGGPQIPEQYEGPLQNLRDAIRGSQ